MKSVGVLRNFRIGYAVLGLGVVGAGCVVVQGEGRPCGDFLLICSNGLYCHFDEGNCGADATGICEEVPEICTDEFSPVCGCDGETYANACMAAAAGVSIDHRGSCDEICGGIAGFACPDDQFCYFADGVCGEGDQSGLCMLRPEACTEEFDPVCGCDGMTYGNECQANVAGTSVQHRGSCDEFCGGIVGFTCPDNQFCLFDDGICGQGDQAGVCMLRPEVCTLEFNPVCGCDGMTYGNECEANAAGLSVLSEGECP